MEIKRSTEKPYELIKKGLPQGMHLHHQVCFSFPGEVTEEQLNQIIGQFQDLYEACGGKEAGIVCARMSRNIDTRKGFVLVESMVFESAEAFNDFHAQQAHTDFSQMMANVADVWIVQDVPIYPGEINYRN